MVSRRNTNRIIRIITNPDIMEPGLGDILVIDDTTGATLHNVLSVQMTVSVDDDNQEALMTYFDLREGQIAMNSNGDPAEYQEWVTVKSIHIGPEEK